MSIAKNLEPIVPKTSRIQIKEFGDKLHSETKHPLVECYMVAYCARRFNSSANDFNGHKSWFQHCQEDTLLTGRLFTHIVELLKLPNFKSVFKNWISNVRNINLSDYFLRRITFNDWEQEIETEVGAIDNIEPPKGTVYDRGADIRDIMSNIKSAKEMLYDEIEELNSQKKYSQIWIEHEVFYFKFTYNPNIVNAIKADIPDYQYFGDRKLWACPYKHRAKVAEFALKYNFVFHSKTIELLFGNKDKVEESYKTSADLVVPGFIIEPYPYQKAGIAFSVKNKRALIADQMGLGKSMQALGAMTILEGFPCLIVAPKSLLYNWRNEIRKFAGIDAAVYYKSKQDLRVILNHMKIVIVSYEGMKSVLPYKHLFKGLIVDESHMIKSQQTQRYQHVFEFSIGKEFKFLLTGTPIMNRPLELIPQLKVLDFFSTPEKEKNFKSRYCGTKDKGAQNLEELNVNLRSKIMIRREKNDVLTDLPDFTRNYIDVDIDNMEEYKFAEQDFIRYLKEVKQFSDRKIRAAQGAEILVRMGILKQIAAKGKMNAIKDFIETCFEEDQKVILFAHHKDILGSYYNLINSNLLISGATKMEDRQVYVDRFQNDPNEKSICLSIRAASVGLNLTAAQIEVFAEFDWNPAIHDQAEARAHRIGVKDNVNAYYFRGKNTIDEDILFLINYKRDIIKKATGSNEEVNENSTIIKDLLKKRYDYDLEMADGQEIQTETTEPGE